MMAHSRTALPEIDEVKISMDSSIDLLMANTDVAQRLPLGPNPFDRLRRWLNMASRFWLMFGKMWRSRKEAAGL